jgi:hypothetical protein
MLAQAPPASLSAQEKAAPPKPAPKVEAPKPSMAQVPAKKLDSAKAENIRQLMELTGAKDLGQGMMKAGMDQFRASVTESQPNNPRATQFVDAFVAGFQKHFNVSSLNDKVVPIYDKYLSDEDVKGLLEYYRSPLGQRMMKVLPEVARESQALGFTLGQKAAQDTFEELKKDFPEFVPESPHAPDAGKNSGPGVKKE